MTVVTVVTVNGHKFLTVVTVNGHKFVTVVTVGVTVVTVDQEVQEAATGFRIRMSPLLLLRSGKVPPTYPSHASHDA